MAYLPMKRGREGEMHSFTTMANYLMLFPKGAHRDSFDSTTSNSPSRFFECKTCNRQFTSFQALGGHRASHKKPRVMGGDLTNHQAQLPISPAKAKSHECSICGVEFAIGQALGGHMRRHKAAMNENLSPLSLDLQQVPAVSKANGIRVFGLDLNLTPLENALEFGLQKVAPSIYG